MIISHAVLMNHRFVQSLSPFVNFSFPVPLSSPPYSTSIRYFLLPQCLQRARETLARVHATKAFRAAFSAAQKIALRVEDRQSRFPRVPHIHTRQRRSDRRQKSARLMTAGRELAIYNARGKHDMVPSEDYIIFNFSMRARPVLIQPLRLIGRDQLISPVQ